MVCLHTHPMQPEDTKLQLDTIMSYWSYYPPTPKDPKATTGARRRLNCPTPLGLACQRGPLSFPSPSCPPGQSMAGPSPQVTASVRLSHTGGPKPIEPSGPRCSAVTPGSGMPLLRLLPHQTRTVFPLLHLLTSPLCCRQTPVGGVGGKGLTTLQGQIWGVAPWLSVGWHPPSPSLLFPLHPSPIGAAFGANRRPRAAG